MCSSSRTGPGTMKTQSSPTPVLPKRFRTAFILFSMHRRPQLGDVYRARGEVLQSSAISKRCGHDWKTLDADQRRFWDEQARIDKQRYESEMIAFRNAGANMPKRPPSAFLAFSSDRRAALREQYPGATNKELSKILSKEWKNLAVERMEEYLHSHEYQMAQYQLDMEPFRRRKDDSRASSDVSLNPTFQPNVGSGSRITQSHNVIPSAPSSQNNLDVVVGPISVTEDPVIPDANRSYDKRKRKRKNGSRNGHQAAGESASPIPILPRLPPSEALLHLHAYERTMRSIALRLTITLHSNWEPDSDSGSRIRQSHNVASSAISSQNTLDAVSNFDNATEETVGLPGTIVDVKSKRKRKREGREGDQAAGEQQVVYPIPILPRLAPTETLLQLQQAYERTTRSMVQERSKEAEDETDAKKPAKKS